MEKETLKLIQSLVSADLYAPASKGGKSDKNRTPLVTISRSFGAGSGNVSRLLAEKLGVQLYDKALLSAIVKEAKGDKHLLNLLDERVTNLADELLYSFFSKKKTNKDSFLRYMAKVILGVGPSGGVIVGRGAHLILPEERAFRVRIEGSLKVCAERVAKRKSIKKAKAEALIQETNTERLKFHQSLAKSYPTRVDGFDITLNTDRFTPEQSVDILLVAMNAAGFKTPLKHKRPPLVS